MKYIFQFGRILAVCFLGEVLSAVLPFPVPASVYGLILLLCALKSGVFHLEDVRDTGKFLTGIMPILFIPAAVGVMELWEELGSMLAGCFIAVLPVTLLVMGVSGLVTQYVQRHTEKRGVLK